MTDELGNQEDETAQQQAKAPACPYGHVGSVFYLHGLRCWQCGVRITNVAGRDVS